MGKETIIDIVTGCGYPADALSNFQPYTFEVDGVTCNSMEGFIQSLKYEDIDKQKEICLLVGKTAKFKGKKKKWWKTQTLFWRGAEIDRHGEEYQFLLDKAFNSLAKNPLFLQVIKDTKNYIIKHSEGKNDPFKTILTQEEFCSRLIKLQRA